jgi:integrase
VAAKVTWYRNAWWVRTRWAGNRKRDRRIGPTAADKRAAEAIAKQVNAALALGTFDPDQGKAILCEAELRAWHTTYSATMKPSYEVLTLGHIDGHLVPHFGPRDVREIRETDLLDFVRVKLDEGLSPKTIQNVLSTFRRVLHLAEREGKIERNPASRIGELMRQVDRRSATETKEVQFWGPEEVQTLLAVAKQHEPRFEPLLLLLLSTGMRRGEALGLRWSDVDFEQHALTIRRSLTHGRISTPKSGRSRTIKLAPGMMSRLFDLLAERRVEGLQRGWPETPELVFCSEAGTAPDERNVSRVWDRIRRRAQKKGVRSLKLHCARHTWATLALRAGKSVRWVADQLGHADPALTLRVYAHAMREEENDLSFADFATPVAAKETTENGSERLYPAPASEEVDEETAKSLNSMVRREGFEPPTLRFEA